MRWTGRDIPDQTGRVAVVTGANSGLGFEVAKALAGKGATVVLACRSEDRARAAAERIVAAVAHARVEVQRLDLASLASVADAAGSLRESHDRVDLLVNNAGLMATDQSTTAEGFELQFGVNHLGHFALTLDLLPAMAATPGARVVAVASMAHRSGVLVLDDLMATRTDYDRWKAYSQSKLANIMFADELHRRLAAAGAAAVALSAHPGGSRTDLGTESNALSNRFMHLVLALSMSAADGALPLLRAATDPAARGGEYYGPRWIFRGHPVLATPSAAARNRADAAALWEASETLTGRHLAEVLPGGGRGDVGPDPTPGPTSEQ